MRRSLALAIAESRGVSRDVPKPMDASFFFPELSAVVPSRHLQRLPRS
jgi:hypothetical protein